MRNLLKGTCPGGDSQTFKQLLDLIICGPKFGQECQKPLRKKKKQQWAIEKPKLDNARKLTGIYFMVGRRRVKKDH